jgi:hypothetical protein
MAAGKGKGLVSDTSVSTNAMKVYKKLQQEGFDVTFNKNIESEEGGYDNKPQILSTNNKPVVTIKLKKENNSEGIKYQDSGIPKVTFLNSNKLSKDADAKDLQNLDLFMFQRDSDTDTSAADTNYYPNDFFSFTEFSNQVTTRWGSSLEIPKGVTVHHKPNKIVYAIFNDFIKNQNVQIGIDFKIPQLNSLIFEDNPTRESTGFAYEASMGDGILRIHTNNMNAQVLRTTAISHIKANVNYFKARDSLGQYQDELRDMDDMLAIGGWTEAQKLRLQKKITKLEAKVDEAHDTWYNTLLISHNVDAPQLIDDFQTQKVDELGSRIFPTNATRFYVENKHKAQQIIYHEMGHHIHQQFGVINRDMSKTLGTAQGTYDRLNSPYIEKLLNVLNKASRVKDEGVDANADGYSTSLKYISTYSLDDIGSNTDGLHEWFSESFSYWAMEHYQGVAPLGTSAEVLDPAFIKIIESVKEKGLDITTNRQLELIMETSYGKK